MKVAVIDASLAIKAVLPDPLRDSCRHILNSLFQDRFELLAPALWTYETTSAITKAINLQILTPKRGTALSDCFRGWGFASAPRIRPRPGTPSSGLSS